MKIIVIVFGVLCVPLFFKNDYRSRMGVFLLEKVKHIVWKFLCEACPAMFSSVVSFPTKLQWARYCYRDLKLWVSSTLEVVWSFHLLSLATLRCPKSLYTTIAERVRVSSFLNERAFCSVSQIGDSMSPLHYIHTHTDWCINDWANMLASGHLLGSVEHSHETF